MPNDSALGAGAGFFQGFNSVFTPFVMGQVRDQQQAQMQNQLMLRKELNNTLAPLMDHGLLDDNSPDEIEAMNFAMSGDANAKPPKNLATTMAVWRGRMQQLQQGIANPEAVAQAEPQTPLDSRMQQAVQGAQQIREGGGTITFRGKNGSVSYAGQSFTEQEKRKANQAYRKFNTGDASLDEVAAGLGIKEQTVLRDRVAMDMFTQLLDQGASPTEAAKATIVGARSMLPELVEKGFGTQQAAERAIATERARIGLIPESDAARLPGEIERARETARVRGEVSIDQQPAKDAAALPGEVNRATETTKARGQAEIGLIPQRQAAELPGQVKQVGEETTARGKAEIGLIPERQAAEKDARLTNPQSPEDRAQAVEAGKLDPKANQRIQETLAKEDRPKLSGPTATERAAIAERESQIEQLERIEQLLPKMKSLGKVAGTLAGISEEYLGGLGLSEADLTGMTEINSFRNRIIKMLSGGAVPAAEYERVQKELPDVKLDAKINRVRIKRTLLNLKTLQKKYGETLFQSGVTNLPQSVDPNAQPTPQPAPAATPAPFRILSVEPVN